MRSLTTPWPGFGSKPTATPRSAETRSTTGGTEESVYSTEDEVMLLCSFNLFCSSVHVSFTMRVLMLQGCWRRTISSGTLRPESSSALTVTLCCARTGYSTVFAAGAYFVYMKRFIWFWGLFKKIKKSQRLFTNLSKSVLVNEIIHPPHRCGISRCWLDGMIIAQVCLKLATIKDQSKMWGSSAR